MFRNVCFVVCVVSLLGGPLAGLRAQGDYAPVTEADVVKLKLNHYFTVDRKASSPDFAWTFTKTEFVLKKAAGEIPADLQSRLLPAGTTGEEIRGKWKVDAGKLILTDIRAGEAAGVKEVILPIYRTAPTVVRIGDVQYVFGVEP